MTRAAYQLARRRLRLMLRAKLPDACHPGYHWQQAKLRDQLIAELRSQTSPRLDWPTHSANQRHESIRRRLRDHIAGRAQQRQWISTDASRARVLRALDALIGTCDSFGGSCHA